MELLKRNGKEKRTERVMQFGEGNFLRGFVDWMFDRLNKEHGGDFGVVAVQPLPGGMVSMLNGQDGCYSLYLRGLQNGEKTEETRIVDCITRGIDPYTDTEVFFECAKNPDLRYIVSNTTEAGIEYRRGDPAGDFAATTFPGRLAMFMKARYDAGLSGFVLLPCELIDKNGDKLKECVLRYAADWGYGDDFVKWVCEENCFTNTLVDRIVTGYPRDTAKDMEKSFGYRDNLIDTAEIFHLWVIEGDRRYAQELPFDKIGLNVIWTDDVTPYKKRKVRILNGAHTMSVLAARLSGLETVGEMMDDELLGRFVREGIFKEIIPTLDLPKAELESFAEAVIERFKNPFIKHYLLSIALNSVSKFRVRVLPSILEYIRIKNAVPQRLICSLAALIMFYRTDEANDDAEIVSFMKNAAVKDILGREDYWGGDLSMLLSDVEKYIGIAEAQGMRAAVETAMRV